MNGLVLNCKYSGLAKDAVKVVEGQHAVFSVILLPFPFFTKTTGAAAVRGVAQIAPAPRNGSFFLSFFFFSSLPLYGLNFHHYVTQFNHSWNEHSYGKYAGLHSGIIIYVTASFGRVVSTV